MITLYQSFQSVCSGKVRLVLEEKGVPYEEVDVDLHRGEQFDPDYMKLNPKAVVPTLIHDGKVLRESTLIMEYLDETFPDPPLKPDDPYLRLRMRLFPKMMDEEVHAAVNLVTYAVVTRHIRAANYTPEELEEHFRKTTDPLRAERQRQVHHAGIEAPVFATAIRTMDKFLGALEDSLAEFGGPWLIGGRYTLADAGVTNYVQRLEVMSFEAMWEEGRPRVTQWWQAIKARPNYAGVISRRTPAGGVEDRRRTGAELWPKVKAMLAA